VVSDLSEENEASRRSAFGGKGCGKACKGGSVGMRKWTIGADITRRKFEVKCIGRIAKVHQIRLNVANVCDSPVGRKLINRFSNTA
jgi:hypothetical protein